MLAFWTGGSIKGQSFRIIGKITQADGKFMADFLQYFRYNGTSCLYFNFMSIKYIIGNHKLNPATLSAASDLTSAITPVAGCLLGITPTLAHFYALKSIKSDGVLMGVQDIAHMSASTGAYTGDVSAGLVADLGADYVIVGHSERRLYHHETDENLIQKISHALHSDLPVIYCVGETQGEYETGATCQVLAHQLQILSSFVSLIPTHNDDTCLPKLVIAYEPVWAIGTGLTPTLIEIETVHDFIKQTLSTMGICAPIIYGGSVNHANASEFAVSHLIDGVLVGGASLQADSFHAIAHAFAQS